MGVVRPPCPGDGGHLGLELLERVSPPHDPDAARRVNRSPWSCDPLEDLLEAQVLQAERVLGARLDLVPRPRRGDGRGSRGRAGSTARWWSSSRCSATSRGTPCRRAGPWSSGETTSFAVRLARAPRRSPWRSRGPPRGCARRRARRTGGGPWSRSSPARSPGRPRPAARAPAARPGRTPSARPARPGRGRSTSRLGLRGRPVRVTVHWCTCSSSAARLTSQVSVARASTTGKRSSPLLARTRGRDPVVGTVTVRTHDGVPAGRVLLEERLVAGAVRPADPGHGAVGEVRQHHRRDLGVVVQDLGLGGAGARVHHLLEVDQRQHGGRRPRRGSRCASRPPRSAPDRDHGVRCGVEPRHRRAHEPARRGDAAGRGAAAVDVQEDAGAAVADLRRG